ncbi:MAG: hypothetical protein ACUVV4_02545 [Candidatus Bathyarchaeia archaeon]
MRDKACPLEKYCSNFKRTKGGFCSSKSDDILDCYSDVEENQFRLKSLLEIEQFPEA